MLKDIDLVIVRDGKEVPFICRDCMLELEVVADPYSGVLDFGASGDFGCDSVTGSHVPVMNTREVFDYWDKIKNERA